MHGALLATKQLTFLKNPNLKECFFSLLYIFDKTRNQFKKRFAFMISLEGDPIPDWVALNHIYLYSCEDGEDDSPYAMVIDMEVNVLLRM